MKRFLAFLLAVLCFTAVFAGCKKKTENQTDKVLPINTQTATDYEVPVNEELKYDINFDEYITLPNIAALELDYTVVPRDDTTVDLHIYTHQLKKATRTEITDRPVAEGDIVTVNYTAVYYGTEEKFLDDSNVEISIGKGIYIPQLEEAIIGMSKGETKTADIVYPSDYTTNKILASAKTTFTIELVKIETAELPELNSETISSFGLGVDSYEDLRSYFLAVIDQTNSNYKQKALYDALLQQTKLISMPKAEYDYYLALFDKNTEAAATGTGVSVESYKTTNYGTQEAYENARAKDAQDNVLKDLIIYSLKEKYDIEVTKEGYNTALNAMFEENAESIGITSVADFHEKMGESVYKGELTYLVLEAAAKEIPDKN